MVRAGCGIGVGQVLVGQSDPDIEQIFPDLPIPALPIWLAAPETLRRTPRIRRVWDHLADRIGALVS